MKFLRMFSMMFCLGGGGGGWESQRAVGRRIHFSMRVCVCKNHDHDKILANIVDYSKKCSLKIFSLKLDARVGKESSSISSTGIS